MDHINEEKKLTEEEVRAEYKLQRKDKIFRKCWPANNDSFYEWCSQYLDYQNITKKKKIKKHLTKVSKCGKEFYEKI